MYKNKLNKEYNCISCNYKTFNKYDYSKHIKTIKHLSNCKINNCKLLNDQEINTIIEKRPYKCECGKTYVFDTGLYKHKKKCVHSRDESVINNKDIMYHLLQENNELKKIIMETQSQVIDIVKNGTNNINCNNKTTFNLNLFLNETCKHAMNITDFIDNLKLEIADIEKLGEIGYINGISNIIVTNLKNMDIKTRPIHCTDLKREILYVKDQNKWDKEENDCPKIRSAIKQIANKNLKLIPEVKNKYHDYNNPASKSSDIFNKIVVECGGGKGDNDFDKETKIIKKVTKEVILEKEKTEI